MGNISSDVGTIRDLITEEVACKAGLLLTDHEAHTVLNRRGHSELWLFEDSRDKGVRMRPEEIEQIIVDLRHGVGNLADAAPSGLARIRFVKKLVADGIDPAPLYNSLKHVVESGKYKVIGEEAMEEMVQMSGMAPHLVAAFLLTVGESLDRTVSWFSARQEDAAWAVPLAVLFKSENFPNDPDAYLDQRYIDYLAQNSEDLNRMHWRNFERLTAEFFRRRGYDIALGPGTKDGGIDVRVWPSEMGRSGPPLLIIQCKRYGTSNDVHVETVKAFWSDIIYEGAQHGLIATTSRVSPEGVKLSRTRKWPLGFAEKEQVSHWVRTMWRHSPIGTSAALIS